MSLFFNHIFSLLTTPPGNLIYHIVLVASIAGTLQRAINILRSTQFPQVRRTVIGLGILLGLQVIILIAGTPSWLGALDPKLVFPPLDRAVTLLSLIWIIWLWEFPEPGRLADYATILLNVLVLVLFGLTQGLWTRNSGTGFNGLGFRIDLAGRRPCGRLSWACSVCSGANRTAGPTAWSSSGGCFCRSPGQPGLADGRRFSRGCPAEPDDHVPLSSDASYGASPCRCRQAAPALKTG